MRHQEATSRIHAPLAVVERRLGDVTAWPEFVAGLEAVEPLGYERYRFHLADGRDHRAVVVWVRHLLDSHRYAWRSLEGPVYAGMIALHEEDDEHTTVRLALTAHPATFLAGLAEMTLPRLDRAQTDLRRLERLVLDATG